MPTRLTLAILTATTTMDSVPTPILMPSEGVESGEVSLIRLLQICDSAFPIGTAAHSFGLEGMVENSGLDVESLRVFLGDYLAEIGILEAWYCRRAHSLASRYEKREWLDLNRDLNALKPARESRQASATLGRRLLTLAAELSAHSVLQKALEHAQDAEIDIHQATAFGLVGFAIGVSDQVTVCAMLWQCAFTLVSAAQRLLPLGQVAASRLLWDLQPVMIETARRSSDQEVFCFTPLIEIESMRHPDLPTRLFIS